MIGEGSRAASLARWRERALESFVSLLSFLFSCLCISWYCACSRANTHSSARGLVQCMTVFVHVVQVAVAIYLAKRAHQMQGSRVQGEANLVNA